MRDERNPTMDELERMLAALPERMRFPSTPDIASRLGAVLPERRPAVLRRRMTWYAVAAAILALIVLTAALPGPRRAVADFFGLPGIRIEIFSRSPDDQQPETPKEIGSSLLFGDRATLDEAQDIAPFAIMLPQLDPAREPDEVYMRDDEGVAGVSLLYVASDDLPQIGTTGVGLLLMEFRTSGDEPFIAKRAMGDDGTFGVITINGREAYWIQNGELIVDAPDLGGSGESVFSRRSGNVLIWTDGQTTFRLESMLSRDAAIEIAESLAPWQGADEGNRSGIAVVSMVSGAVLVGSRVTARMNTHEASHSVPDVRHVAGPGLRSDRRGRRMGRR
jgi:hypothetical protein